MQKLYTYDLITTYSWISYFTKNIQKSNICSLNPFHGIRTSLPHWQKTSDIHWPHFLFQRLQTIGYSTSSIRLNEVNLGPQKKKKKNVMTTVKLWQPDYPDSGVFELWSWSSDPKPTSLETKHELIHNQSIKFDNVNINSKQTKIMR